MFSVFHVIILIFSITAVYADSASHYVETFTPCSPSSEAIQASLSEPSSQFCAQWSPDFPFHEGFQCCPKPAVSRGRRNRMAGCAPARIRGNYCHEMTLDQITYSAAAAAGQLGDLLDFLTAELRKQVQQSYCSVNNGFLVHGRPVVPTAENRIELNHTDRCLNFGTDAMAIMLEWVGRQVAQRYVDPGFENVHLILGNISAPRGGCLLGRSGKRGHLSHTSGQDADIGFLSARAGHASPKLFSRTFDAKANWWLIQKFFKNPYACIKVIFLDRKHIRSLAKIAHKDPDWIQYSQFIQHVRGHRNHMHVRIGDGAGRPGCVLGAKPELELEEVEADFEEAEEPQSSSAEPLPEFPKE